LNCAHHLSELDTAVTTFREVLRHSWTKRAIRNLTTAHPPQILAKFTIEDIKLHRDETWEQRQMSYHDTAVEEVNSLVRKYNGIAPYAVRRAYYSRSVEVERLYEECAEDILRGIRERSRSIGNTRVIPRSGNSAPEGIEGLDGGFMSIKDVILGWFDRIAERWRAR
jgi:DnaJ homolog subfamily C member 28